MLATRVFGWLFLWIFIGMIGIKGRNIYGDHKPSFGDHKTQYADHKQVFADHK